MSVFSPEELLLLSRIKDSEGSAENYRKWAQDERDKIYEAQKSVAYHTRMLEGNLDRVKEYETQLEKYRQQLKELLNPTPVVVLQTLPETTPESITEDCVDQLESRSKSEASVSV